MAEYESKISFESVEPLIPKWCEQNYPNFSISKIGKKIEISILTLNDKKLKVMYIRVICVFLNSLSYRVELVVLS